MSTKLLICHRSTSNLGKPLPFFILLPLKLLYALVLVVHGHAEHLLGTLLTDNVLVEVLLQALGSDSRLSLRVAQRASSGLAGLIDGCVRLIKRVKLRRQRRNGRRYIARSRNGTPGAKEHGARQAPATRHKQHWARHCGRRGLYSSCSHHGESKRLLKTKICTKIYSQIG